MSINRHSSLFALVMAVAVTAGASDQVATWEVDRMHSTLGFGVKHMMVSTVRGTFNSFTAGVQVVGDDPTTAKVNVSIDVASIDTGVEMRDNDLRSANFFEVAKFPNITFVSKKVERTPAGLRLTGDLTIRDVTREVVLDVTDVSGPMKDQRGKERMGAHAATTINRRDFGLTYGAALETGGLVVANEVALSLDVELVKKPEATSGPK